MNNQIQCKKTGVAEQLLDAVRYQVPVVDKVLQSAGECTVSEYLQQVCQVSQMPINVNRVGNVLAVKGSYSSPGNKGISVVW